MWSLLASLPTEAPQTVGLSGDLPYGLLIGLLGAGLQIAVGEIWRLVAGEASPVDVAREPPRRVVNGPRHA